MTYNAKPGSGAGSCESLWLVWGPVWLQYVTCGSHTVSVLGKKPASRWTCILLECSAGVFAVHVCVCVEVTRCHGLIPGPERILGQPWPEAAILTLHGPVSSLAVAALQP